MIIYFNDTANTLLEITPDDNSYRYRAIKGDHNLTLYFSLPEHIEIPIGAYCEFQNEKYTLMAPENLKMQHTRNFQYTIVFESSQASLQKYKFRELFYNQNTDTWGGERRLKFDYTAKPQEHLQMLVNNLNKRESGWTLGTYIESPEKAISYNHTSCMDALNQIADTFETEWEIIGKEISLRKVEYNKENPLPLSYGKGNGFKSGIQRSNNNDSTPVEVLFVQGGERNIDYSKYGNYTLLLPKSQTIKFDGTYFEDEEGFVENKARQYKTDADGYSITRADKELQTNSEESFDCSEIYPSRIGTVTDIKYLYNDAYYDTPLEWTPEEWQKVFIDIIDETIPEALDFSSCQIEGETMTIIFQSGELAGKEFEVNYIHKTTDNKPGRRFEIVQQIIDGVNMPGGTFIPKAQDSESGYEGDKYAVFHCQLPNVYICDNVTKTGASWDMFRQSVKYLYDNESPKFTFTGELDGIWAKNNWLDIGGKIKPGGFVEFTDAQFQKEPISIRITGIKEYINNPYSPEIELSNSTIGGGITSTLKKVESNEVAIENGYKDALQFTKRRFRDAQETISMLNHALSNYTNAIKPSSVQTMDVLVGDESLQYRFVDNMENPSSVAHNVTYDKDTKTLTVPAGIIQHMTLGIDSLSSSHENDEYNYWSIPQYDSPTLNDKSQAYYLYAKVDKKIEGDKPIPKGEFKLTKEAFAFDAEPEYYYLLMGILNSECDGERSYISLYGFTEISPARITTPKIISADKNNYLDFENNAFRIGNDNRNIEWNTTGEGNLSMKNASIEVKNHSNQTMVAINGEDGSGQLAGGNFTWDAEGNIHANKGTFSDIIVNGSFRSPFARETDSSGAQSIHDNVATTVPNNTTINGELAWDAAQSGRRMCIANYKWGNEISKGTISYSAPNGKFFFENGTNKSSLTLSRECVELIGYGTSSEFYGWIVLRRINLMSEYASGRPLNIVALGTVIGTPDNATITYKSFNKTIDNDPMWVAKTGEGQYVVRYPSSWFANPDDCIVMVTGLGYAHNTDNPIKATIVSRDSHGFMVKTSDDATANDGSFMFMIINMATWQ